VKLSENANKVLEKRYYRKDASGKIIEDWKGMLTRIAQNISAGDKQKFKKYFDLLDSGYFLPNSPTLMNAGNDLQQLSACFVLPIEDSMESIFETIKNAALIHKSGGGTGFSFSRLREANSRVRSTNGVSSGPISFLKVYNAATDAVKQGGTRRGANMAILNVNHPQIMDFITCKEDTTQLTNFNISVGLTEDFMNAVYQDKSYELVSPSTGDVVEQLKARDVFDLIVEMAYKNGEPGIVFLDRINRFNPTPELGEIESTNPCGEQPLLPYEACNLGSINLAAFISKGKIDWEALKTTVYNSVDFLDDVIDASRFPLLEIRQMTQSNRKIGLGVMGWADLLYQLSIPYASEEAITLAEEIMEFMDYHAKLRSCQLAQEIGSFPNFEKSIYKKGKLKREKNRLDWRGLIRDIKNQGIRNATVTTVAPTGTISMILDTSSGIEPQFSLAFTKNVMDGESLLYVNKYFEKALNDCKLFDKALLEKIAQEGSIQHLKEIPVKIRKVFQTSHDISPEWHIRMQAAFQKYTDNAVSKTINFKRNASSEDIRTAFEFAYKLGCKGVTVYRDGSRENQVLQTRTNHAQRPSDEHKVVPRNRPEITQGITQKVETGCGHMYVTINSDEHGACEVFVQMGKVGGCASAQLEAIARLASLALRSNLKLDSLVRQLKGIRCQSPMWHKGKMITSCGDAVGQALEQYMSMNLNGAHNLLNLNVQVPKAEDFGSQRMFANCPECGSSIEHLEGCLKCPSCGWSKC
jgi:ribonucleoside-diphosphate reductase alpha chain